MLLDRLKAETAERHDRIERDLDLMRPDLTRAEWVRLVARFYGFYQPWEEAIARAVGGDGDLAAMVADRRKVAWLERDLADLDVGEEARRSLPRCRRLPVIETIEQVLGSMYVLEGSRLGAAYLLKAVERSADPVVAGATAYLSHGAGQHLWPSFLEMLETHAATLDDDAAALTAAREAFALFNRAAARLGAAGSVVA